MNSLEMKNFSLSFGSRKVLNQIDLTVGQTGIHSLLGPSGCGKSTLLLYAAGLLRNQADLKVSGELRVSPQVGMVFQKPYPFAISVLENVALALKEKGFRGSELMDRAQFALSQAGLWGEVKDRLHESALKLSGGQQQRLCLARVLALEPNLLLLDEPCSSLDPLSTRTIESTLIELSERTPMLIVTHNLAQARRISSQMTLIWNDSVGSRVLEKGATESVFRQPGSEIAKDYLSGALG